MTKETLELMRDFGCVGASFDEGAWKQGEYWKQNEVAINGDNGLALICKASNGGYVVRYETVDRGGRQYVGCVYYATKEQTVEALRGFDVDGESVKCKFYEDLKMSY